MLIEFENKDSAPVEATYEFVLQENATVCAFTANIDGKDIKGKIMEKEAARDRYDNAIASGGGGYLLEESKKQELKVFTMSIGNLPPNKKATVKIEYVTEAALYDGKITVVIPRTTQEKEVTSSFPRQLIFNMSARFDMSQPILDITSLNHEFSIFMTSETSAMATLMTSNVTRPCDIELFIRLRSPQNMPLYQIQQQENEKVIAVSFAPNVDGSPVLEMFMLIDCSGSMQGESILKAKETLENFLHKLPPSTLFNIVVFGSNHRFLFSSSMEYSPETLRIALDNVKGIQADMGGTELLQPLQAIFARKPREGIPQQIFILTDGQVDLRDQCIQLVRSHARTTRVFTFGIGTGVDVDLVRGLAKAGEGRCEIITDTSSMPERVMSQLNASLKPALSELSCSWGSLDVAQAPFILPPLYSGSRFVVYGLLRSPITSESDVVLSARVTNRPISLTVRVSPTRVTTGTHIFKLFARALLRDLEEGRSYMHNGSILPDVAKREAIQVSRKYNVLSSYTSFVAVESRTEAVAATMKLKTVAIGQIPPTSTTNSLFCFGSVSMAPSAIPGSHQPLCDLFSAPPPPRPSFNADPFMPSPMQPGMGMGLSSGPLFGMPQGMPPTAHPQMYPAASFACTPSIPAMLPIQPTPFAFSQQQQQQQQQLQLPLQQTPCDRILALVSPTGLWNSSSEVLRLLGLDVFLLFTPRELQSIPNPDAVYITCIVCLYLRKKFPTEQAKWNAAVNKALTVVTSATASLPKQLIPLVCTQGHALRLMSYTELLSENRGYTAGFVCDLCFSPSGPAFPTVYHCSPCTFDLCVSCVNGGTPSAVHLARKCLVDNHLV
ncbi:Vault protein inter-alpha-trypsin domain [Pelomyxa schiedti]|nr:Vault protein inter-alpha-trypsin domain [Pelomyxa schiedti]